MADGESTAHAAAELESSVDPGARYQARIALVTAIVALISALLGPLVSLQINKSQIDSQAEQNKVAAKANAQQSEGEFVRTQRSEAYTDLLTKFNNATLDLIVAAGFFGSANQNTPVDQLNQQQDNALQAVKDVTAAYYQVTIVASEDANDAADALYAEFGTWSGELLTTIGTLLSGANLTDEQAQSLTTESTTAEYGVLLGLSNAFIAEGRDDMHSDLDD